MAIRHAVELSHGAAKTLRELERKMQLRIVARLQELADNPRPRDAVKLQGVAGVYRVREGNYRILYEIFDKRLVVHVLKIVHRREV
ncbi:MAG: type II toxin-antitoxin system RelE family toxin [Gammaproteobacteria bacterium]